MKKKLTIGDFIIAFVMIIWGLAIFYPFYNTVLVSFMTEGEYLQHPFALYVRNISFDAYRAIFENSKIFNGFRTSLTILLFAVPLEMILVTCMAYAMSRKNFLFRNVINNMLVFTMYFGGGIIPLYLLVRSLGLINTIWSVILIGAMNVYDMILVKNYFYTIPDSLEESAKIDGANDITICFRIYVPLAKPILATILLFCTVNRWNEWYNPLLFINETTKWPLQLVLREIIGQAAERLKDTGVSSDQLGIETFSSGIKMATIVVTMVPVMLVYPFVQKYFMKGMMVGAVKS